jgi:hypothetical protein
MKPEIFLTVLVLLTFSTTAVVATYHSQLEKEGPQASYVVGFASDEPARIELSAENRTGLNLTYEQEYSFDPDEVQKRVQRKGSYIPLKEFYINISSTDPQESLYEVPVVLRAYSDVNGSGSATPKLVNEREYVFRYRTQLSPDYGLDGDLINSSEQGEPPRDENPVRNSSENTIMEENQTSTRAEGGEREPGKDTTLLLAAGVLLVFGYTLYEALT